MNHVSTPIEGTTPLMTTDATWRIQVSFKNLAGTLINCRAETGDELVGQLQWVHDHAGHISSAEQSLTGTSQVAQVLPLAAPAQQITAPPEFTQTAAPFPATSPPVAPAAPSPGASGAVSYPYPQQQVPRQQAGQQPGPVCQHGIPAKYVAAGISRAGKPYKAFWACSLDKEQDCRFRQDAA